MERDPKKCIPANALLEEGCSHSGFVLKDGRFKQKQTRYFVLQEGCLYYYKDFTSQKEQDAFCILGYSVNEEQESDRIGISLVCPGKRSFNFSVSTEEERKTWVSKLRQEITRISGDGSDSTEEGNGEQYDYAYQRTNVCTEEEQHNYEETDCVPTFQPQNNNKYAAHRNKQLSNTLPQSPPPVVPTRPIKHSNPRMEMTEKNYADQTSSLPRKGKVQQSCTNSFVPSSVMLSNTLPIKKATNNYTSPPVPNPNTKPNKLPQVSKKPQIPLKPTSNPIKRTEVEKLQRRMQQSYEVQNINSYPKDIDEDNADSDADSEGYLDLEGEGVDLARQRAISRLRPIGGSCKKGNSDEVYEKPRQITSEDSDDALLPLSVYQENLSRDSAEDILKGVEQEGMYLIRKGRTGRQVISVFVETGCKHYQVFTSDAKIFLKETEPVFKTLPALVRHYFNHPLPTCPNSLTMPYS